MARDLMGAAATGVAGWAEARVASREVGREAAAREAVAAPAVAPTVVELVEVGVGAASLVASNQTARSRDPGTLDRFHRRLGSAEWRGTSPPVHQTCRPHHPCVSAAQAFREEAAAAAAAEEATRAASVVMTVAGRDA